MRFTWSGVGTRPTASSLIDRFSGFYSVLKWGGKWSKGGKNLNFVFTKVVLNKSI